MHRQPKAQSMMTIMRLRHYSHRYSTLGSCPQLLTWKLFLPVLYPFFMWKYLVGEVDVCTLFKSIERCSVMCDLSTLCQKVSLTPTPPNTSKTHQSSESKMSEAFYLSLWATLPWLMVWWSSLTAPPPSPLLHMHQFAHHLRNNQW